MTTCHLRQSGQYLSDSSYSLEIPYRAYTELIREKLKEVPEVEVLQPVSLRERVVDRLFGTHERYRPDGLKFP